MNPNHYVMRKRERKDLCQRTHIDTDKGRASVTWSEEEFKFWSRTGVGTVKPYKVRELNKLKGFECKSRFTMKYESTYHYYLLIPVIVNKKKRSNEKENVIALNPGVRTFQIGIIIKDHFVEYGKQDIGKLFVLGKKMDKIQSKN
jgi:hypothetical protein